MFGLEFSEIFDKLPVPLQIMLAIGVLGAGAWMAIKGHRDNKASPLSGVSADALTAASVALELKDAHLRADLIEVVNETREGLERKLDAAVASLKQDITRIENHDADGRKAIYQRLQDCERRLNQRR